MTKKFEIGAQVQWVSSNAKKVGEVIAIVPPHKTPAEVGFPKAGGGGLARDHETYIVRGRKQNFRGDAYGSRALYWPLLSLVEAVA